jgi:phosphate-selective porin OprO/OprP
MMQQWVRRFVGVLVILAMVVIMPPGRVQAADPSVGTVKLYVDQKTGQVFAKPGPGRAPLDLPVSALPELTRQIEQVDSKASQADSKAEKALNSVTAAEESLRSQMKNDVYAWLPAKVQASSKGFLLESEDKAFELKLTGYMQFDSRWYTTHTVPSTGSIQPSTFVLRRIRPTIEGKLFKYFKFKIQPDFGEGTFSDKDMYFEFDYTKLARLRMGKFKVPSGLEVLESSSRMLMIERSLTQNVEPERDLGVMLHGELLKGALLYQTGIFNGVPDRASTVDTANHSGKDFAGRILSHPFRLITDAECLQNFGLGVASTIGSQRTTLPTYVTQGRTTFFSYVSSARARGQRWRVIPQLYYYYGPFLIQAEYSQSTQGLTSTTTSAASQEIRNWAYNVQGAYVITGEDIAYDKNVTPAENFDPFKRTLGALALTARWSQLGVDGDAFKMGFANINVASRGAKEWTIGLNWYLNPNIKAEFNYGRTSFNGGAANGGDKQDESVLETRVQFMW